MTVADDFECHDPKQTKATEINPHARKRFGVRDVLNIVAQHFGLKVKSICSADRSRRVTRPRLLVYMLARQFTIASYSQIIATCGRKNHTTVYYGIKSMHATMQRERVWREHFETLQTKINEIRAKILRWQNR